MHWREPFIWSISDKTPLGLLGGVVLGVSLAWSSSALMNLLFAGGTPAADDGLQAEPAPGPIEVHEDEIQAKGISGLVGNTPLVRINSLSDALGIEILGKAEWLNPGGSVKDRVALKIIDNAEREGHLIPFQGSTIFEGTVGSTGISIATMAKARGYNTTIVMPDDVADEKHKALLALGARVVKVRPASIVDKKQFVNLAREMALEFGEVPLVHSTDVEITRMDSATSSDDPTHRNAPRGFFADQFENKANHDAHFEGTGPEIWRQTNGGVDAFVSGAGTGGTIAGVGAYLKSMNPDIKVVLADPEGSGLYNKVKYGVLFDKKEKEGTKRRHQVDTVVEGIGINRLTNNFSLALPNIDDAYRVTDTEAVAMSRYLVGHDGLFLGSSSACNLVACVRLAKTMEKGSTIVTILCDSGSRHYSKVRNDDYLEKAGIPHDPSIIRRLLAS
ncbi:uncharacterized protein EI90DRAFT_2975768 [Cantharellus anzutake]|uniref:uncharacterized protein n=1 Tax=Cantharellus anzutake TaxID=1750568 RepID=UPI001903A4A5|nr:uncharacterized protein EI90DRAFT_2975768 [Cantharellus anzutake]KAF8326686.1 hypothetical protein EI90DRAFT_2975768 [Cantharellus anzutake]